MVTVCASVGGCEFALRYECLVHGWFLPGALSYWDRLWHPTALNLNKKIGKYLSYLFLLIFVKCMYSLHLFQCLVLDVFWVIILKFDDVFVNLRILQEINSSLYHLPYGKICCISPYFT